MRCSCAARRLLVRHTTAVNATKVVFSLLYVLQNVYPPSGLGKKNYLFCRNDDIAENAAVIYSLMGCCKAGEVNLLSARGDLFSNEQGSGFLHSRITPFIQ